MKRIFIAVITAGMVFTSCTKKLADNDASAVVDDANSVSVLKGNDVPLQCDPPFHALPKIPLPHPYNGFCLSGCVICYPPNQIEGSIDLVDCNTGAVIVPGISFHIEYFGPNHSPGELSNPDNWHWGCGGNCLKPSAAQYVEPYLAEIARIIGRDPSFLPCIQQM